MGTKGETLDKHLSDICSGRDNTQYSNLNLNQKLRNSSSHAFPLKSISTEKKEALTYESNNRTGLASIDTAFCKLAPENLIRLDGLHVLDEGLCKTLIFSLFAQFRFMDSIRTSINRSMLWNGASSLPLKHANAHELRKIFTLSVPLAFIHEPTNLKLQASVMFWNLCRLIYSKYLTTEIIDEIAPLFEMIGAVMEKIFGASFKTIKGHRFFGHGGAEIINHGTPADFSAAAFESANRLLRLLIDPYNTRGYDKQMIRKHIQNVLIEDKVWTMCKLLNLDPERYKDLYEKKKKSVISQSVKFVGELLPLMVQNEMSFFSVRQNGFTFKFNPTKNSFAFFKATIDGVGYCYKALIGIEREGEKFILSHKISTFNPIASHLFNPEFQQIISVLTKYQSFVFQITETEDNEYILVPYKNVISFVLNIEFSGRKFLIDVSERYNKT